MQVILVYLISLHQQKVISHNFSRLTTTLLSEKQNIETKNLHHRKAVSLAFFVEPKVGDLAFTKKIQ